MNLFSFDKKYPAFTMTELLVGMIVSGIVISAVWTAFRVVTNLAQSSLSSVTQVEEISFFKRSFSTEFQCAKNVIKTEEGYTISFENPENEVKYKFLNEYVLRERAGTIDTFHVQTADVVSGRTADPNDGEVGRINELKCTVLINGTMQDLILSRKLSSRDLMKSDD